jgi:serine/threonine protein kinase
MSPNFSPGDLLGHYEIKIQLGAGGMGEVYLAQDTKLDRKVALKILPADVAANQDCMRRFVQEAKAAAALNHPNIAHIYEIGEAVGTNFIAMEFVEGVTLREKIHQERTELRKLLRRPWNRPGRPWKLIQTTGHLVKHVETVLDNLHSDQRFKELMKRVNLPE